MPHVENMYDCPRRLTQGRRVMAANYDRRCLAKIETMFEAVGPDLVEAVESLRAQLREAQENRDAHRRLAEIQEKRAWESEAIAERLASALDTCKDTIMAMAPTIEEHNPTWIALAGDPMDIADKAEKVLAAHEQHTSGEPVPIVKPSRTEPGDETDEEIVDALMREALRKELAEAKADAQRLADALGILRRIRGPRIYEIADAALAAHEQHTSGEPATSGCEHPATRRHTTLGWKCEACGDVRPHASTVVRAAKTARFPALPTDAEDEALVDGMMREAAHTHTTELRYQVGRLDEIVGRGSFHLEDMGDGWHLILGSGERRVDIALDVTRLTVVEVAGGVTRKGEDDGDA